MSASDNITGSPTIESVRATASARDITVTVRPASGDSGGSVLDISEHLDKLAERLAASSARMRPHLAKLRADTSPKEISITLSLSLNGEMNWFIVEGNVAAMIEVKMIF